MTMTDSLMPGMSLSGNQRQKFRVSTSMKHSPVRLLVLLAVLAFFAPSLRAEVQLGSPFTSHMVLQRDAKVPVWGTAAPGEMITVEFAGQKVKTIAGADGHWRLYLRPLKISAEGRTFTVTGSQTSHPLELADVLVGEVWLASGQSNMDFSCPRR